PRAARGAERAALAAHGGGRAPVGACVPAIARRAAPSGKKRLTPAVPRQGPRGLV
ncbi:hypothetical protein MNEG_14052, partial [Monoraphidium neglectum]